MMTLPTLLLVATTLVTTTTAAAAAGTTKRSLQEYYDEGQADGNYYDNTDDAPFYQDSLDRLNEDLNGMWQNSPSEWIEEYWEVFGAIVLLACYLALLICICCTVHCCQERRSRHAAAASLEGAEDDATSYVQATDSNDGLMVVATESQFKERQQKRRFLGRLRSKNNKKDEGLSPIDTTLKDVSSPDDIEQARYNQVASPIAPGEGGGGGDGEYEPPDNDVASAILRQTSPKLGSEDYDDDDNYHRRMVKSRSSRRKSSSADASPSTMSNVKEMYDEVVDLWSEFLGFRKKSSGRSSKRSLMRDERDRRFSSSGTKHRSSRVSSSGRSRRSRRSMEEITDDNNDHHHNNTDNDQQQYVDTGMSSMSQSTLSPTNAIKSPPRVSSRTKRVASSSMEQPNDDMGVMTNETGDDSEVV